MEHKPRIVVYTTVFGHTDPLHEPKVAGNARFVCFTDQPIRSQRWHVIRGDRVEQPTRMARCYKTIPHVLFKDADWTLWMDANFTLLVDPASLLKHGEFVNFRHPDRTRITTEAEEIIRLGKAKEPAIRAQLADYHVHGFDTEENPMNELSSNGVILRKNTVQNKELNESWAEELRAHTLRDQMSLDYAAWKLGMKLNRWPGTHRNNPYFNFTYYKRPTNDF